MSKTVTTFTSQTALNAKNPYDLSMERTDNYYVVCAPGDDSEGNAYILKTDGTIVSAYNAKTLSKNKKMVNPNVSCIVIKKKTAYIIWVDENGKADYHVKTLK